MVPYFRKHQTLDPGDRHADAQFMPTGAMEKYHGSDGPIHTSFNDYYEPFEYDFCEAAYEVGGKERTLVDAWSGDHMGFYSSLAAISRSDDPGRRSYSATGYLRPNLGRPNLKVLCEALAGRVLLEGNTAKGVEFYHENKKFQVKAIREVILSGGVINSPQLLELSGIGDPEILKAAGVECLVQNDRVGANFQDHVLGGVVYDLAPGLTSLDSLQGEEYLKAQQQAYEKTNNGPLASPGMLMGFVSYASLVDQATLEDTIKDIRENSLAVTDFEKRQEDVIVSQLSDPNFANIQTFCKSSRCTKFESFIITSLGIGCQLDVGAGEDQIKFFQPP